MIPITVALISMLLAGLGVLAGLAAWVLTHFVKKSPDGRLNLRQGGFIPKSVFFLAGGAGLVLGTALVGFAIAGIWWLVAKLATQMSPADLAYLSILIGIAPFVLAIMGAGLARISGGSVNAAGAENCKAFGIDLNNLVYGLFMSYWLVFFTGGIAVFGLIGSGLWAIFN
jgi:hypothetical protein